MNDTLIQSFLAIATEGGFNRAAEKIYISQPNLSRNIARLEKELGTKLFDRSQKQTVLTKSGTIYFSAFQKMISCMEQAREQVQRMEHGGRELIHIGYVRDWNLSDFIRPVLRRLHTEYPELRVSMEACSIPELSSRLSLGQLDLIFTLKEKADGIFGAETRTVDRVPEEILYSEEYFGKGKRKVSPKDFSEAAFLVLGDDMEEDRIRYVRDLGIAYGFVPDIQVMHNMESIFMNVESGLGVTVCHSWIRVSAGRHIRSCRLGHTAEIGIAWKRETENVPLQVLLKCMDRMQNMGESEFQGGIAV